MKSSILRRTQVARVAACAVLLNFSVPGGALAVYGAPLRERVAQGLQDRAKAAKDMAARRAKSASRLLSATEERSLQGRTGENPYLAGQSKWDVVYKGVNLMTGNYSTSAIDLSFDGGYGIPVNVTRSYSANNMDEGPFGKGWTLSADVRSAAGGLLKSSNAPVRTVPVGFKERPAGETDPNAETATGIAAQPVEAVIATDAGGDQETVQKDVDGVLTTPPWDLNVNENTRYAYVPQGGAVYQVMTHNETVTVEGARYIYDAQGSYSGAGMTAWGSASAVAQPANVMKVTSATDRHGNVTTYAYSPTVYFDYAKSNGTTHEHPLTQVSMPGGHLIAFAWGTSGNALGRLTSVTDNPGSPTDERKVQYGYGAGGLLTSATTPGGKTTNYGYGSSVGVVRPQNTATATGLLTTITDPRGLTASIAYYVENTYVSPSGAQMQGVRAYRLVAPNGDQTYIVPTEATWDHNGAYPADSLIVGYGSYRLGILVNEYDPLNNPILDFSLGFGVSNGVVSVYDQPYGHSSGSSGFVNGIPYGRWLTYDQTTANLLTEDHTVFTSYSVTLGNANLTSWRRYPSTGWLGQRTVTTRKYNFMGAPMSATTVEQVSTPSVTTTRTSNVAYAYWGPEKYFQQKAVRTGESDNYYRYTYTDYYPNTDSNPGRRGQTYRVYDAKNGGVGLNTNATLPTYTPPVPTEARWRYQVQPTAGRHAAEFDYDTQGRPTDVWKLQKAPTNGAWTYVRTHTSYGGDGAPQWGQASSVVEDYGGINRTTQTMGYTSWGKANDVMDAAGHRLVTSFDKDGRVLSVTRTDGGGQPVLTYAYGDEPGKVEFGQPTMVTDGLSQVSQSIGYAQSGGGIGLPATVTEQNGADTYVVGYTYNAAGERATATYATPSGTTRWAYGDYTPVGDTQSPHRVFQTMRRLDASGNPTSEEFHYSYDSSGRLLDAIFAQTPSYTPASGDAYYDANHLAASRARTHYDYDAAGRITRTATYWESLNGSNYGTPTLIGENSCAYETSNNGSNLNRGLKTASYFAMQGDGTPRTETYGYDALNDRLTEAHYGDGPTYPYADEAWGYDAAGNRSGNVVDSLNRASTAGGLACESDVLGNQTSKTNADGKKFFFDWDCLNRLTAHGRTGAWSANYWYRADGMRVSKLYNGVTTRYRHDGQMAVEDMEQPASGNATITRYGLGARGVDFMEQTVGSTVTKGFPLYDAHGNNVATLYRNGNTYAVQNFRRYSAWGNVRGGSPTGDPKGKYCASLGHRQDDESGLVYMRARYYDPSSGRFMSEDSSRDGSNWFAYCGNDPVNAADQSGKRFSPMGAIMGALVGFAFALYDYGVAGQEITARQAGEIVLSAVIGASSGYNKIVEWGDNVLTKLWTNFVTDLSSDASVAAQKSLAGAVFTAYATEGGTLIGMMMVDMMDASVKW